jgi:hypothetical protein
VRKGRIASGRMVDKLLRDVIKEMALRYKNKCGHVFCSIHHL